MASLLPTLTIAPDLEHLHSQSDHSESVGAVLPWWATMHNGHVTDEVAPDSEYLPASVSAGFDTGHSGPLGLFFCIHAACRLHTYKPLVPSYQREPEVFHGYIIFFTDFEWGMFESLAFSCQKGWNVRLL